ncbi:hypothetical protein CC2G_005727 [Coprinopsis cinerea AmutBmut pab1-1]|nr:hypothetical protein CC2G_005727 [Coprinopsis cinerea AmutBmut pab1-1]
MALHTWNVFGRFRAGIFGLATILGLGVAVVCTIMLVNGWAVYLSHQKAAISFLLAVNVVSSVALVLMSIFRFRPIADLVRVATALVFQIGLIVVFTLSTPTLPCVESSLVQSCKALDSIILFGSCFFCVLMFLYIVILIPTLKQPLRPPPPPPPIYRDLKRWPTEGDGRSSCSYSSWDRIPEKPISKTDRSTFTESYYHKLQSKVSSPERPKPPPLSQSPLMHNNPFLTPETALMELSNQDSTYLRPYTPMQASDPNVEIRGSMASFSSFSSRDSAGTSMLEYPRAALTSPQTPSYHPRRTRSIESAALLLPKQPVVLDAPKQDQIQVKRDSDVLPAPAITLTDADFIGPRRPQGETKPLKVKRRVPQQLFLDDHLESLADSNFSAVPRSPSPISGPYSPSSFPVTPNSGALPSHPRLTMHFRELKLAKGARTLTS